MTLWDREGKAPACVPHQGPVSTTELGAGIAQTAEQTAWPPGPGSKQNEQICCIADVAESRQPCSSAACFHFVICKWGHLNCKAEVFVRGVNGAALGQSEK